MHIDHVVLAARSGRAAERALDEAGLGVARGRRLPGLGLANLVVPLGRSLLEIHHPDGSTPAADAPPLLAIDRAALEAAPGVALVPVAWIVAYEREAELRDLAAANDAPIHEVADGGPGFPPYVLAGFGATFDRPWLPALIHWPVPEARRPSVLPAPHRRTPTGITRLEVAGPAEDIARWCGGSPDGLVCAAGSAGPRAVTIGFTAGTDVTFGVTDGAPPEPP